jgi:hypothetical protein
MISSQSRLLLITTTATTTTTTKKKNDNNEKISKNEHLLRNNNNRGRRKTRTCSAMNEITRMQKMQQLWHESASAIALENEDERVRDVEFREARFRELERILEPLLGGGLENEEVLIDIVLRCPRLLLCEQKQLVVALVLLSEDLSIAEMFDQPEVLIKTDEELAAMRKRKMDRYREQRRNAMRLSSKDFIEKIQAKIIESNNTNDDIENAQLSKDGRTEGENARYAVQGTMKGTSTREGDICARFWNLWGGSNKCRMILTKSDKDSIYRNPQRLEAKLLALDRVFPFLDVPLMMHKDPRLFELDTSELIFKIVKTRRDVFPMGSIQAIVQLAPGFLLEDFKDLREAVECLKSKKALRNENEVYEECTKIFLSVQTRMNKAKPYEEEKYEDILRSSYTNYDDNNNLGCSI